MFERKLDNGDDIREVTCEGESSRLLAAVEQSRTSESERPSCPVAVQSYLVKLALTTVQERRW
jgi:hypothetical protein